MSILCWLATTEEQQRNTAHFFLSAKTRSSDCFPNRGGGALLLPHHTGCNNIPATGAHGPRKSNPDPQAGSRPPSTFHAFHTGTRSVLV